MFIPALVNSRTDRRVARAKNWDDAWPVRRIIGNTASLVSNIDELFYLRRREECEDGFVHHGGTGHSAPRATQLKPKSRGQRFDCAFGVSSVKRDEIYEECSVTRPSSGSWIFIA